MVFKFRLLRNNKAQLIASSDHVESYLTQIIHLRKLFDSQRHQHIIERQSCPLSWLTWQERAEGPPKLENIRESWKQGDLLTKTRSKISAGTWLAWPAFGLLCLSGKIQEDCVSPHQPVESLYRGQTHKAWWLATVSTCAPATSENDQMTKDKNLPVSIMEFALCLSMRRETVTTSSGLGINRELVCILIPPRSHLWTVRLQRRGPL